MEHVGTDTDYLCSRTNLEQNTAGSLFCVRSRRAVLYVEVHGARLRQYMPRAMRAIRACYVGPCASPLFFLPFFPPGRLQSLVAAVRSQGPPLNPQPPKQCFVPSCFLSGDLVDHLSSPWIRSNAFFVVARSTYIYRNLLLKHM